MKLGPFKWQGHLVALQLGNLVTMTFHLQFWTVLFLKIIFKLYVT